MIRNRIFLFICTFIIIYVYKVVLNNCKPSVFFLVMKSPAMHSFISGTKKCYFSNLSINRTFDESFMWHECALINHIFTFLILLQFVIAVKFLLSLKKNLKIFWNYSNLNHSHFKKLLFFHESTFVSIKTFPYISWTFHFPQIDINIFNQTCIIV